MFRAGGGGHRLFAASKGGEGGNKLQRLERIISNRGVGSRNEVSKLFKEGRVKVNGKVIRSGADKYPVSIEVEIDGETITGVPLLAIYHKPVGVHSTMNDGRWGRESLQELSLEYPFLKTMHPVGRLDADTSGLLLFSSNGFLTQTLLHPSTGIQREYEAHVAGKVDEPKLAPLLRAGIKTTEGVFAAELVETRLLTDLATVPLSFGDKEDEEGEGEDEEEDEDADADAEGATSAAVVTRKRQQQQTKQVEQSFVRVTVTEGKYRMVRRVLHNAGHSVLQLHRVRYGNVQLGDLEEGEVRAVSEDECAWAKTLI